MSYYDAITDQLAADIREIDGSHETGAGSLADQLISKGWINPQVESPGIVNIVFDGPPSHDGPRFIEVEDVYGASVRVGHWHRMPEDRDGEWALQLSLHPTDEEYENALAFAEGSAQNVLQELHRQERVNETLLARNAELAAKLEAISKLVAEEKYQRLDAEFGSEYWQGYDYMGDLVQQIIESPEERG